MLLRNTACKAEYGAMPREKLRRESSAESLRCGQQNNQTTSMSNPKCVEDHQVVESDDDDLSAEELEWGLSQRATDPYYRQRKHKGRFMFVKIAGCEGFHCYETDLLTRLKELGVCVDAGIAAAPMQHAAQRPDSLQQTEDTNSPAVEGTGRTGSGSRRHKQHRSKYTGSRNASVPQPPSELLHSTATSEPGAALAVDSPPAAPSNNTKRKQWQKPSS